MRTPLMSAGVQPPREMTALGPVSTGALDSPMSASTQQPGHPGPVGRPLLGRRTPPTDPQGDLVDTGQVNAHTRTMLPLFKII